MKHIRIQAGFARSLLLCVLSTACSLAHGQSIDERKVEGLQNDLNSAESIANEDYLRGDPQAALDRFRGIAGRDGWLSLWMAGNTVWVMHPEESFQWHTQAYEQSGDNLALLELAYHYTRREECQKAVDAWAQLDAAGMVSYYMPMLAGYCYLKLGKDKQAFSMFARAEVARYDLRFEDTLKELWGSLPPVREHADRLRAFKDSGALADLQEGLRSVIRLDAGTRIRGVALLAYADAAKSVAARLGNAAVQLECLRPAFVEEAKLEEWEGERHGRLRRRGVYRGDGGAIILEAWRQRLDACGLLVDGHPLPEDPALALLLVVSAMDLGVASEEELLRAHGKALYERANSQLGDIQALRILADLQTIVEDHRGLRDTDELGWSRYADSKFAASRVIRLLPDSGAPTPEVLALVNQIHRQFPEDQRILHIWLRWGNPPADAAREGWRQLALMEFHKPSLEFDPIFLTEHATLLHAALDEYREAIGL